jgi:hypothetical protein
MKFAESVPVTPAPVILVNPFITSQERYGNDIGDIGGHQMPLGIFSLAAYLRVPLTLLRRGAQQPGQRLRHARAARGIG